MQRGRFVSLRRRRQIQQNYFVGFRCCLCGRIFCCLCARAYFDEIRPVLTSVWSRYEEALRPGLAQEYLVLKVVIALLPVSLLFLYLPRHRSIGLALGLPVRSKILASFARLDGSENPSYTNFRAKTTLPACLAANKCSVFSENDGISRAIAFSNKEKG